MNTAIRRVLDRALELNERVAGTLGNGFDWLFRRDELVKLGQTWFELVYDGDPMSVRYYELPEEDEIELADGSRMPIERKRHPIPLVLVPPLGVTTETFDLMPNRSLVRYMSARGFKTYMIDWGKPQKRHAHLCMRHYADEMMSEALAAVRKHSGSEQVSLMGWCMGGLISLMHAGLKEDPRITNIVTIASPIDMRGGGIVAGVAQALNTPAKLIRKYTNFRLHNLNPEKLHLPAWTTTLAFKLTDPIGSITTYWDLVTRLWDREFVESHSTTSHYLNNMLVYPAGMVQDMIVRVAVDNKLCDGEIEIGDKISRFKNITAAMYVFAGETDVLVPEVIAKRVMDLVPNPDKQFETAPGGHMGVILGSKAQKHVWVRAADWLAQRSSLRAAPRAKRQTTAKPKTTRRKKLEPA